MAIGIPFAISFNNRQLVGTVTPEPPIADPSALVENVAPANIILTFESPLNEGSVPATTAFSVFGKTVSNVVIASNVVTLTVSAAFIYGDGVYILYTPPSSNPLKIGSSNVSSFLVLATNNIEYSLPTANLKFDYFAGDGTIVPSEVTITGGYVTAIADRTANDYDLTETGAGNTTHELSVSGVNRGALVLSGNSYFLRTITGAILANSTTHTIVAVYSTTEAVDPGTFYMEGSTASSTPLFRSNVAPATNTFGVQHRDDASNLVNTSNAIAGVTTNDGNVHVVIFRRNDTSHQLIVDDVGNAAVTKTMGTTSVNRMGFGALMQSTISGIFKGKIFAVIGYESDNHEIIIIPISRYYNINLWPTTVSISLNSTIDTI